MFIVSEFEFTLLCLYQSILIQDSSGTNDRPETAIFSYSVRATAFTMGLELAVVAFNVVRCEGLHHETRMISSIHCPPRSTVHSKLSTQIPDGLLERSGLGFLLLCNGSRHFHGLLQMLFTGMLSVGMETSSGFPDTS